MVAAEVPHNLLEIDRAVHRLLVNREMLIPGYGLSPPYQHPSLERGKGLCRAMGTPLHPGKNNQMIQRTKLLRINTLSTPHTPHAGRVALYGVGVREASIEGHEPCLRGIAGVGSRRPKAAHKSNRKRIASRQCGPRTGY